MCVVVCNRLVQVVVAIRRNIDYSDSIGSWPIGEVRYASSRPGAGRFIRIGARHPMSGKPGSCADIQQESEPSNDECGANTPTAIERQNCESLGNGNGVSLYGVHVL